MTCEQCGSELESTAVICPGCGARLSASRASASDWREQVRDTVRRHQEKKREKLERRDDAARQLSIFPEESLEDEEQRQMRRRRAEIRARVEERVARRHAPDGLARVVDAGELPLGGLGKGGAVAAAAARELANDPSLDERDPKPARFAPLSELAEPDDLDHVPDPAAPEPFVGFGAASAFERILSGFIDLAFVSLIQLTLFYLTTHLVAQRLGALPQSALVAMGLVGAVLAAGYFLFFWSLSGQTLGKLLTGSRVVDRKGGALGFGRAALRLFATLLAALPLAAGFIGLWTDAERRGWHDRIAGTKVIRG